MHIIVPVSSSPSGGKIRDIRRPLGVGLSSRFDLEYFLVLLASCWKRRRIDILIRTDAEESCESSPLTPGSKERAANSGGYQNKSTDVWFYVAIIGFFVFLRSLPWIMRRLGCVPPRPERVVLRHNAGEGGTTEELSEEERKELVTNSLSTTKVTKHSPDICSGECVERQNVGTGKDDPSRILLASVSTATAGEKEGEEEEEEEEEGIERAGEDVGDGNEASSNDDQTTLSPCHICLDHFRIGEEISWSNV